MADRYWVGGTATWDATAGTKWATTSGGAGGASVPTSSDNVFFDAGSGTCTVTTSGTTTDNCNNITWSSSNVTLSHANNTTINVYGSLDFTGAGTYTRGGSASRFNFAGTSGSQTIKWAGKQTGGVNVTGAGTATWTWQDAMTINGNMQITGSGTVDFNEKDISCSQFNRTGTGTLTIDISNVASFTCSSQFQMQSDTGLTVSASGSVINLTGGNTTFLGGASQSYNEVKMTGAGACTVGDGCGITKLTRTGTAASGNELNFGADNTIPTIVASGNNGTTQRLLIRSDTKGTQRTVTVNTAWTLSNVDFQDMVVAGSASSNFSAITGLCGDGGNNSGLTATTPQNNYWVGGTGSFSNLAKWANASGGSSSSGRVPLLQDTAIWDASSGSGTVTLDMSRLCNLDFSASSVSTITKSTTAALFGSLTLKASMTINNTNAYTVDVRGSKTVNLAGNTWNGNIIFDCGNGTYTLAADWNNTGTFTGISGTFDGGGFNLTHSSNYSVTSNNLFYLQNVADHTVGGNFNSNGNSSGTYEVDNLYCTGAINNFGNGNFTINHAGNAASVSFVNAGSLTLGDSEFQLTGTGTIWNMAGGYTFNCGTSTLRITDTSATAKTFAGGSKTYYDLYIDGAASNGQITISGNNGWNEWTLENYVSLKLTASSTQTLTVAPAWVATSGQNIVIVSSTSTNANISCASGTAACDYLTLQDCTATGGATFYAGSNSTDNGDNPGWSFSDPPSGGINGSASITQAAETVTATGTLAIAGQASITQANESLSATALLERLGVLDLTQELDALTSTGTLAILAMLDAMQDNDTLTAAGVGDGGAGAANLLWVRRRRRRGRR